MTSPQIFSMRLIAGRSKHPGFTLSSSCSRALFRVGSALECNWRVQAAGVADHHFMLLWNSVELSIVDVGAGDLWVDGENFHLTRSLHSARIDFGSASIVVDRGPHRSLAPFAQPIAQQGEHDYPTKPGQELSLVAKTKIQKPCREEGVQAGGYQAGKWSRVGQLLAPVPEK